MGLRFTTRAVDPMTVQEALQQVRSPWRLHGGQEVILQEGCVAHVEARGHDRCHQVREQTAAVEAEDAVWMGGLAFDHDHHPEGVWQPFPAAGFCLPKRQWRWQDDELLETTCDAPEVPHPQGASGHLPRTSAGSWNETVAAAQASIARGEVGKVVLARCETTPRVDPKEDLQRLMEAERGIAFAYDHGAVFYGVSPERLVRLEGKAVTTHALAGSAGAGQANGRRLLESRKDALEHDLVAAFVHRRLEAAGVTAIQSGDRRLRPLRHVQHLETPISGRAREGTHVLDLAAALHPTPAVCGTPPHRSMDLIRRLEGFPRGWYAGAVGWFDQAGEGEFAIALRCALQAQDRYLFAGAGIVEGSEAQAEWEETEAKLATLREAP